MIITSLILILLVNINLNIGSKEEFAYYAKIKIEISKYGLIWFNYFQIKKIIFSL